MKYLAKLAMAAFSVSILATAMAEEIQPDPAAAAIAQKYMLVDTHIDAPERLLEDWEDVTQATQKGNFDYPRARKGGLNIPFMSIYTAAETEAAGTSFQLANRLIDSMEALVGRAPGEFVMVTTPSEAEQAMQKGLIGLALGMENGSPLDGKLENVAYFRHRGVSYITLTHSLSNHIADSSYDENRQWNGLSAFGKDVIAEMNRQGVMVDISHVSDQAFWQVLELSKVPVIASHSSPRQFTPGWERNMSDEMIRALAGKGGVIQINFGSSFLTAEAMAWYEQKAEAQKAFLKENGFDKQSAEAKAFEKTYRKSHPFPFATLEDLVASFQHVIELVGVDHVGIGSDFDGVGDSLPIGMKDVSQYPNLIERLLGLGYSDVEIAKIMGGNLIRVWRAAEDYARNGAAGAIAP